MAEVNKRKRELDGGMTNPNTDTKQLLRDYAEAIFYECTFSAQFTANTQILFRVEDIVPKLPVDSFAARFPEIKQSASTLIGTCVNSWKRTLDPALMNFFDSNDLAKALGVVAQKGVLNVTLPDKLLKLPVKDGSVTCIMAAIDLLRYPLARMECVQRGRTGALLDLEKDAVFIMAMHDECEREAGKLLLWLDLLSCKVEKKKCAKTKAAAQ